MRKWIVWNLTTGETAEVNSRKELFHEILKFLWFEEIQVKRYGRTIFKGEVNDFIHLVSEERIS